MPNQNEMKDSRAFAGMKGCIFYDIIHWETFERKFSSQLLSVKILHNIYTCESICK